MNQFPPPPPGAPPPVPGAPAPSENLATVALVLGILSVTVCGCLTGLPAVICGHMARERINRAGGALAGRGQATTGLVLGYLSLVGSVIIAIAALVMWKQAPAIQSSSAPSIVSAQAALFETALAQYRDEKGRLPALEASNGEQVDAKALSAILSDAGLYAPGKNGLAISNAPSDLWLEPLNIAIDLDSDGEVLVGSQKIPGIVAVWSSGPNKQNELGEGDDVRSW